MSEASSGVGPKPQGRIGTLVAGRWRIDARIGAGGMASVYAVSDEHGRRGAMKVLHPQFSRDPSTRARFLREGKVGSAIDHPAVVAVLDDGMTDDGQAFLVFELLEGETIEARRARMGGTLPLEEVLDVADQALGALAAAHDQGIIHRDVKPENFFRLNDGTVKLLDFGLARIADSQGESTRTGVTIGTPEFMPPEQVLGKRDLIDARSDIWGLGATMYHALTGEYVHDAPTLGEQLRANATQRARPIRSVAPHVPTPIAFVVDRALALEMDARWPSALEMQEALHRACMAAADSADSLTISVLRGPVSSSNPSSNQTLKMSDEAALEMTVAVPGSTDNRAALSDNRAALSEHRAALSEHRTARMTHGQAPAPPPGSGGYAVANGSGGVESETSIRRLILGALLFVGSAALGVYLAWRYFYGP